MASPQKGGQSLRVKPGSGAPVSDWISTWQVARGGGAEVDQQLGAVEEQGLAEHFADGMPGVDGDETVGAQREAVPAVIVVDGHFLAEVGTTLSAM